MRTPATGKAAVAGSSCKALGTVVQILVYADKIADPFAAAKFLLKPVVKGVTVGCKILTKTGKELFQIADEGGKKIFKILNATGDALNTIDWNLLKQVSCIDQYGNVYNLGIKLNDDFLTSLGNAKVVFMNSIDDGAGNILKDADGNYLAKVIKEGDDKVETIAVVKTGIFKNTTELVNDIVGKRSTIKSTIQNLNESKDIALAFFNKNKSSLDPLYQNDFDKWFDDIFKNGKGTNPAPFEAHHVLPINVLETNQSLQDLLLWAKQNNLDFEFNNIDNGMMIQKKSSKLDQSGHAYHPKYNDAISAKVTDLITKSKNNTEAFAKIKNLILTTKSKLKQDVLLGNLDVNDIINF